jgi:tryptophan synthase alpha chain
MSSVGEVVVPVPPAPDTVGALETALRAGRDTGRKLLVPYITGGLPGWTGLLDPLAEAGADAIEVGIPFSDPVMDGPVIQESSERALAAGATPRSIVAELAERETAVPVAVMTYYNLVFRWGHQRCADELARAGVAAAILPDLPLDEVGHWARAADRAGVETVLLVAPTTPDDRLVRICARSRGFVYGVGLLGITGERDELAATAVEVARRLRAVTDKPVLIGVGISTPAQAVEACSVADGVVIGSVLVRRIIEGATAAEAASLVAGFRKALEAGNA